jgi:hypothetical protein
MKPLARILSLLLLVSAALFYAGCDGDNGNKDSEETVQFNKLKGTWSATIVDDGIEERVDFPGLTLTIGQSGSSYNYIFAATSWPSISPIPDDLDTFKFKEGAVMNTIIRNTDQLEMNYTVSDTQLVLTFTYAGVGFTNGRVNNVAGDWEISFNKTN